MSVAVKANKGICACSYDVKHEISLNNGRQLYWQDKICKEKVHHSNIVPCIFEKRKEKIMTIFNLYSNGIYANSNNE